MDNDLWETTSQLEKDGKVFKEEGLYLERKYCVVCSPRTSGALEDT